MAFSDVLNEYLENYSISASALSEASGVSKATISRFKNGKREPDAQSEAVSSLAKAIASLSGDPDLDADTVLARFCETLDEQTLNFEHVAQNLNTLIDALGINAHDLSRYLKFDPSYLSRIRSGQRRPANPIEFCTGVSNFVSFNCSDAHKTVLSRIMKCPPEALDDVASRKSAVLEWLTEGQEQQGSAVVHFLQQLNEFDLNEYIRAIHFDELKVPTVPFQLPTAKSYYTIEGFREAELDWLKATVTSKSMDSVIMYSDMPMTEMSKDEAFGKKWMYGIALLLKKGLHLNVVHNIDRSFYEMMLGLESWIPLYMTGQVSSFYLRGYNDSVFSHFVRVSGAAAITGEAIVGAFSSGCLRLTKNKEELAYCRKRGEDLLKKATPLIEVYTEGDAEKLEPTLDALLDEGVALEEISIDGQPFKNISIHSIQDKCVIVSKSNAPKIHFVIRHPKLRKAIENISVPIVE